MRYNFNALLEPKPVLSDRNRSLLLGCLCFVVVESISVGIFTAYWFGALGLWMADRNGWVKTEGVVIEHVSRSKTHTILFEYVSLSGDKERQEVRYYKYDGGNSGRFWQGYEPGDAIPVFISRGQPRLVELHTKISWYHDGVLWRSIELVFATVFGVVAVAALFLFWSFWKFVNSDESGTS